MGIVSIFGPEKEKVIAEHVRSICDTVEVPHISVQEDLDQSFQPRGIALNLYPHVNSLSRVSSEDKKIDIIIILNTLKLKYTII